MDFKVGDIVEGIVTSIKKYGAFLSFENGYVGLLHISEISSKFVHNIYSYVLPGDKIKVYVKEVNSDQKSLSVSLKDLPSSLNEIKRGDDNKKITYYIKNVDFTKLEKSLPKMIEDEINREKKEGMC